MKNNLKKNYKAVKGIKVLKAVKKTDNITIKFKGVLSESFANYVRNEFDEDVLKALCQKTGLRKKLELSISKINKRNISDGQKERKINHLLTMTSLHHLSINIDIQANNLSKSKFFTKEELINQSFCIAYEALSKRKIVGNWIKDDKGDDVKSLIVYIGDYVKFGLIQYVKDYQDYHLESKQKKIKIWLREAEQNGYLSVDDKIKYVLDTVKEKNEIEKKKESEGKVVKGRYINVTRKEIEKVMNISCVESLSKPSMDEDDTREFGDTIEDKNAINPSSIDFDEDDDIDSVNENEDLYSVDSYKNLNKSIIEKIRENSKDNDKKFEIMYRLNDLKRMKNAEKLLREEMSVVDKDMKDSFRITKELEEKVAKRLEIKFLNQKDIAKAYGVTETYVSILSRNLDKILKQVS